MMHLSKEDMRGTDPRPPRRTKPGVGNLSGLRAALLVGLGPVGLLFRSRHPRRDEQQKNVEKLRDHKGYETHRQGQHDRAAQHQSRDNRSDRRSQHADNKEEKIHLLLSILLDHSKSKTAGVLVRRTCSKVSKRRVFFQSLLSGRACAEPFVADTFGAGGFWGGFRREAFR